MAKDHIREAESKMPSSYTLQEIYDAVGYGFKYAKESQHHGGVPKGNILQWLVHKKNIKL